MNHDEAKDEAKKEADVPAPTRRERVRQGLPLAAALVITVAAMALGLYFRDALLGLGRFGLIGIFIINLVNNATVILPAPFGIALTCLFADVAHPIAVGLAGGLGSALGEYTGYMAGMGGTAVLPRGRVYSLLRYYMRRAGPAVIFVLALVPNPLFDVGGLLAGVLHMPRRVFLAATIAGKVLRYLLIAYGCAGGLPFLFPALHTP
jgi:membrane protein YqaA with SNARE-associated domain